MRRVGGNELRSLGTRYGADEAFSHLIPEALPCLIGVSHEVPSQASPPLGVRGHGTVHVPDSPDDGRVELLLRQLQLRQVRYI